MAFSNDVTGEGNEKILFTINQGFRFMARFFHSFLLSSSFILEVDKTKKFNHASRRFYWLKHAEL